MAEPEREYPEVLSHGRGHGRSGHEPDCDCTRCRGFQPGHSLTPKLSHGSYSPRALSPRAQELSDWAFDNAPWLCETDRPAVALFAMTMSRVEHANAALQQVDDAAASDLSAYASPEHGLVFDRLRRDARSWANQALSLASELGLTPAARARLQLDVASTRRQLSLVELHQRAQVEQAIEGEAEDA